MTVGKSSRTPFKHWIINAELGRLAGVFSHGSNKVPVKANPFVIYDLCAGDGANKDNSSPSIILKHTNFMRKNRVNVDVNLFEKSTNTFESLYLNFDGNDFNLVNKDSSDFILNAKQNQASFILVDPNNISDLPVSEKMVNSFNAGTTFVITLGCNVGGLKRLDIEERR